MPVCKRSQLSGLILDSVADLIVQCTIEFVTAASRASLPPRLPTPRFL
jgi:hypothetical protein